MINGFLLQHINIKRLYSAGMLLSGVSMAVMMSLGKLGMTGVGVAGLMMGMSFGLFWANRDFLALSTTNDSNRNYYYGVETFFYTNTYVIVPVHHRMVHCRHGHAGLVRRRSATPPIKSSRGSCSC